MNQKHTKEEMLAFLEYLKEKKEVILDQQEGGKKIFHISRDSSQAVSGCFNGFEKHPGGL